MSVRRKLEWETTPRGVVQGPNRRHTGVIAGHTSCPGPERHDPLMALILWIIAVFLVISGIVSITRRQLAVGIALIVVGLLVGPGGVSLFT